jgi:hypothetical protein
MGAKDPGEWTGFPWPPLFSMEVTEGGGLGSLMKTCVPS